MKKIIGLVIIFMILYFFSSSEAKTENELFDIEIKLYSGQELKNIIPDAEFSFQDQSQNSNYLFGWVKIRERALTRDKGIPSCKITAWNKFFKYTFNIIGVTEERSYFLIPLGVLIFDRNIEYRISTVP